MKFHTLAFCLLAAALHLGCSRDPEVLKQRFFELGQEYYESGQYDEASILYRRALQQDRRFAPAYCALGETELKREEISAAGTAFLRCFELEPNNLRAFDVVADLYLASIGREGISDRPLQELIQLAERAEANNPGAFEVLRVQGLLARTQGDVDGALERFRQAVELRPGDERVTLPLAATLLSSGLDDEFERVARSAIEQNPTFGPMYDLLYVYHLRNSHAEEAEATMVAKADAAPDNAQFQFDLIGHYWRGGQRDRVESLLEDRLLARGDVFPNAEELVGDFYLQRGETARAIEYYQAGRAADPDADSTKHLTRKIIVALTVAQRWAEATAMVEELLVQDPENAEAISLRGALRLQSGDREQVAGAVQDLEEVVRRLPDNAVLRYRLGDAYLRLGDVRNARLQFNEALVRNPDYALPKYGLMRIHLSRNELTQTVVLAEEILEDYPNDPMALLSRATARIGLREYESARGDLEDLVLRGLLVGDATIQLARLDVAEQRLDAAEQRLRELATVSPDDDRARRGLAELFSATGRTEQAREVLVTRAEETPERLDYRFDLALYSARLGRREDSILELRRILEQEPAYTAARVLLGQMLLESGQREEARTEFIKAAEGQVPSPEALVQLGTLLAADGDYAGSRPYFERALQLAPDHAVGNNNLAYILAEIDTDLDVALTHAQRAKALAPANVDFSDTLGLVYLKRGLYDNAIEVFREIVPANPGRVDFRYHYARALFGAGQLGEARSQLEAALENLPTAEQASQIRELLAEIGS